MGPLQTTDAPSPLAEEAVRLFLSFAPADEPFAKELEEHLALLQRRQIVQSWHTHKAEAGSVWQEEVRRQLGASELVVFLVSSSFLASDQNYAEEMAYVLEQQKFRHIKIIPILIRHCRWQTAPFANLQIFPRNGIPISQAAIRDAAWADIVGEILEAARDFRGDVLPASAPILTSPLEPITHGSATVPSPHGPTSHSHWLIPALGLILFIFIIVIINSSLFKFSELTQEQLVKNTMKFLDCGTRQCKITFEITKRVNSNEILIEGKSIDLRTGETINKIYLTRPQIAVCLKDGSFPSEMITALKAAERAFEQAFPDLAAREDTSALEARVPDMSSSQPSKLRLRSPLHTSDRALSGHTAAGQALFDMSISSASSQDMSSSVADLGLVGSSRPEENSVTKGQSPKIIPEAFIKDDILNMEIPHLPEDVKLNFICQEVEGNYEVCIDKTGKVAEVNISTGIIGADKDITAGIKKWLFKPQKGPVCFVKRLTYFMNDGDGCKKKWGPRDGLTKVTLSSPVAFDLTDTTKTKLQGRILKPSYKVCLGIDGKISEISPIKSINKTVQSYGDDEAVMRVFRSIKFKPQPVETCFVQVVKFEID